MPSLAAARSPLARAVVWFEEALASRRGLLLLLLGYVLAWALYGTIQKSSQDINADMAEMVVWSRSPAFGYPRHPPLPAWIVAAWFRVFPHADWAYYLLATVTLGAGLWLAYELAGEWLEGEKRLAVPLLLALVPFYNFQGLKFDQNSLQIPLWALATWGFVRSLRTRSLFFAVLAAIGGAGALLTKYWAGFLLVSLPLVALLDRDRVAYFRSAAPWVSAGVGLALIAPHLHWLVEAKFISFAWSRSRAAETFADLASAIVEFIAGGFGYAAAVFVALLIVRPARGWISDTLFPSDPHRRTAALLFWLPPALGLATTVASNVKPLSLWNAPSYTMLVILLLSSPLVTVTRRHLSGLAMVSAGLVAVALLVAPIVAAMQLRKGVENEAAYGRAVTAEVDRAWRRITDRPLRLIAGPFPLASTAAFYHPDRPETFSDFSAAYSPLVRPEDIRRHGMAIACPLDDSHCLRMMQGYVDASASDAVVEVARHWAGLVGPAKRFRIVTVPPRP